MSPLVRWLAWRWLLLVAFACTVVLWWRGASWWRARLYMAEQLYATARRMEWQVKVRAG